MGDRGNIVVRTEAGNKGDVWFYTHWSGSDMAETVRTALARKERWEDPSYLARIIFCQLISDSDCLSTIKTKTPLFIWGPPGIGKSNIVHAACESAGVPMIDLRLALLDSIELRGLPTIHQNGKATVTRWAIPEFLPQDPDSKGVIFLDELTAARPDVQVIGYQLADVRKRGIGEAYKLPDGWAVIGASNRQGDRAVSNRMSSALAGRFKHIDLEVELGDWCDWALANGITPEIIAFLRNQGKHLYDFDPNTWKENKPFASPRAWEVLNRDLLACPEIFNLGKSAHNTDKLQSPQRESVCGIVGESAGIQFFNYLRTWTEIPTVDQVCLDPDGALVPSSPGGRYAIACGIAHRANKSNIKAIAKYLSRLPKEFNIYTFKDIARLAAHKVIDMSVLQNETFNRWSAEMTKEGLL